MLFIVRLTQQCDVKLSCEQCSYMFQPHGVILSLIKFETYKVLLK